MRSIMLIPILFIGFFVITIVLFASLYVANTVDDLMNDIDFSVAEGTLQNRTFIQVYNDTLGEGVHTIQENSDNWGMFLLLGMVLLMFICGFTFNENQKLWLILEFVILIVAFIFAITFSFMHNELIHTDTEFLDIYSNDLQKSSTFMLTLPVIIPVVWMIMMILTYGRFKKQSFKEANTSVQGVGF